MVERNLSLGGTVVLATVLAGCAAGYLLNPDLYRALFDTFAAWGLGRGRLNALLCFVPVLAAGSAAAYGYDFLTGQGAFVPDPRRAGDAESPHRPSYGDGRSPD
jgi:hypothetical protein